MVNRIIPPARRRRNVSAQPTMRDVAEAAGVSQATVSYVLTGKQDARVSIDTRQRVLDAAERLAYRPNAIARAMALGKSRTVGIYEPHVGESPLSNMWSAAILRGVSDALHMEQHHLLLFGYRETDAPAPGAFLDGRVDSLIILSPNEGDTLASELAEQGLCVAVICGRACGAGVVCVDVDNVAAGERATEYLIRLGHQRIAHLKGPEGVPNATDRLQGFCRAMLQNGLRIPQPFLAQASFYEEGGYAAAARLLNARDCRKRPTAFFAANDLCALGAMKAIADAGMRVPQDVAVVGFDDTPISELARPRITTMRQPAEEMGRVAARALLSAPAARTNSCTHFAAELVIRESCGGIDAADRKTTGAGKP